MRKFIVGAALVALGTCACSAALIGHEEAKENPVCELPPPVLPESQTFVLENTCKADLAHNAMCVYVEPATNCLYLVTRDGCYAPWRVKEMRCIEAPQQPPEEETL